jgi:hypothetical protein
MFLLAVTGTLWENLSENNLFLSDSLIMEAAVSFETSVNFHQHTRSYNKGSNLFVRVWLLIVETDFTGQKPSLEANSCSANQEFFRHLKTYCRVYKLPCPGLHKVIARIAAMYSGDSGLKSRSRNRLSSLGFFMALHNPSRQVLG